MSTLTKHVTPRHTILPSATLQCNIEPTLAFTTSSNMHKHTHNLTYSNLTQTTLTHNLPHLASTQGRQPISYLHTQADTHIHYPNQPASLGFMRWVYIITHTYTDTQADGGQAHTGLGPSLPHFSTHTHAQVHTLNYRHGNL